MRILITGITGMIGTHFARAARDRGLEVCGIARNTAASRQSGDPVGGVVRCDMLDRDALETVFRRIRPDVIVHLAAQAFNSISWELEESTYDANFTGTLNVLRCCRRVCPAARVLLACSSAEYGVVEQDEFPLKEDRLLRPVSPYGVSKVATECLGYQYFANYGMQVYLPRLFIHVGTGHPPATAIQNFARQLALIAKAKEPPRIRVGALDTARDFIDVRDGVEGMLLLLDKGRPGEPVNICTGKAYRIEECLRILLSVSGLNVELQPDPELFRPSDEKLLVGDNRRLLELGWKQNFELPETLKAVYQDWLSRVQSSRP